MGGSLTRHYGPNWSQHYFIVAVFIGDGVGARIAKNKCHEFISGQRAKKIVLTHNQLELMQS